MIDFLLEKQDSHFQFPELILGPFSRINLFVGANNSGKSRFSRALISNELSYLTVTTDEPFKYAAKQFRSEIIELFKIRRPVLGDYREILATFDKYELSSDTLPLNSHIRKFFHFFALLTKNDFFDAQPLTETVVISTGFGTNQKDQLLTQPNYDLEKKICDLAKKTLQPYFINPTAQKQQAIYFPVLRGLRTFSDNEANPLGDLFKEKTIADYFKSLPANNPEIYTGLSIYDDVQKLLLGNLDDREAIADTEKFLSSHFFEGQKIALIPKLSDKTLHIKISNEKEQPIHFLGDGLQTLILLILPLLKNKSSEKLIFIEEPELFLHPGMQRKLLQTLQAFENFQFFITTHSNHLLDIALEKEDLSIFTFKKSLPEGDDIEKLPIVQVEKVYGSDDSPLNLLEVQKSSVFLSNCTIWVEGITDRLYLQRYLDIIKKVNNVSEKFREDVHYSFVEYGGNNITHFNFNKDISTSEQININKICGKSFLIVDNDGGKKAKRHQQLQECLKDNFYILQCNEIENLLTPEILKNVIAEYEKVTVDDINSKLKITYKNYRNKKLGTYIDQNLKERSRQTYADSSGTITGKVLFSKKALNYINTLDDMSEEARQIAENLLEFIKKNNL